MRRDQARHDRRGAAVGHGRHRRRQTNLEGEALGDLDPGVAARSRQRQVERAVRAPREPAGAGQSGGNDLHAGGQARSGGLRGVRNSRGDPGKSERDERPHDPVGKHGIS